MKFWILTLFLFAMPCAWATQPSSVAGYRMSEIAAGSLYEEMGLKNGDILLEINGRKVADSKSAEEILASIKSTKPLKLKIKRDGKVRTLEYRFK